MSEILNQYIWWIVGVIIPTAILLSWKFLFDFEWFHYWFNCKLLGLRVGTVYKLGQDTNCDIGSNWSNSEKELCESYMNFLSFPDETAFKQNLAYLHKAEDGGRKPVSKFMWVFLIMLVVAEGLGFSYLLGNAMAGEASENTQTMLMWAVVFVISGILMWLTHRAGEELYVNKLVNYHMKHRGSRRGEDDTELKSRTLGDDQSIDDNQSRSIQCLNRVDHKSTKSYPYTIGAIILITAIAIGSTWVRFYHMEDMLTHETTGTTANADPANPFGPPTALSAPQIDAQKKAVIDGQTGEEKQLLGSFVMLAFIFVFTQIIGISTGYKHKFAGRYSEGAYKATRGFTSYQQVREYYKPRIQRAEASLKVLQNELSQTPSGARLYLKKRFSDWLNEVNGNNKTNEVTIAESPQSPTIEQAKDHIASLEDTKEMKDYYATLHRDIKKELKPWIDEYLVELRKKKDEADEPDWEKA